MNGELRLIPFLSFPLSSFFFLSFFISFFKILFILLRERAREQEQGRRAEGDGEAGSPVWDSIPGP